MTNWTLEKSMAFFWESAHHRIVVLHHHKKVQRLKLTLNHISTGLSFHQSSAIIYQQNEAFGNAKLVGVNNHNVNQYVHAGDAINLQYISDILSSPRVWLCMLAIDSSKHQFVSYLDIQIHVCSNDSLDNLYIIIIFLRSSYWLGIWPILKLVNVILFILQTPDIIHLL